jgi:hypothetical protein
VHYIPSASLMVCNMFDDLSYYFNTIQRICPGQSNWDLNIGVESNIFVLNLPTGVCVNESYCIVRLYSIFHGFRLLSILYNRYLYTNTSEHCITMQDISHTMQMYVMHFSMQMDFLSMVAQTHPTRRPRMLAPPSNAVTPVNAIKGPYPLP